MTKPYEEHINHIVIFTSITSRDCTIYTCLSSFKLNVWIIEWMFTNNTIYIKMHFDSNKCNGININKTYKSTDSKTKGNKKIAKCIQSVYHVNNICFFWELKFPGLFDFKWPFWFHA